MLSYYFFKLVIFAFLIMVTNSFGFDEKIKKSVSNLKMQSKNGLKAPTKLSNCKAMLDDNSIIDLTSLDNPKNPRYKFSIDLKILNIIKFI